MIGEDKVVGKGTGSCGDHLRQFTMFPDVQITLSRSMSRSNP